MSGFFEEIKRRKVYRVAVAYFVVAGGVGPVPSPGGAPGNLALPCSGTK